MISFGKSAEGCNQTHKLPLEDNHASYSLAYRSPSLLAGDASAGATELKFRCTPEQALGLEEYFRPVVTLDPHANHCENGKYHVSTLYTDTPDFSVFHREQEFKYFKFRVRRYGDASDVFLEKKCKRSGRVSKYRIKSTLTQMAEMTSVETEAPSSNWFKEEVQSGKFSPVCELNYHRRPFFAVLEEQPIRLTFDFDLRARANSNWVFDDQNRVWMPLFAEQVICEMKFTGSLPVLMKSAIETFQLLPGNCSKYRNAIAALGLAQPKDAPNA
ncbi:polyphosphate polymerase domain-containing protein [Planctomicrobium sp. SH527]|uniref:polyphosphate polymerase domain-containing protein n=1 Tax=Planctomicrobium sp. SH527 TaxID=3448123 RepID=UPI003F5B4F7E